MRGRILLDWLKIIPEEIAYRWEKSPFMGRSPPFQWDALGKKLGEHPELAELRISASECIWRTRPSDGFPTDCTCALLGFSGLLGRIHCLLSMEHVELLMSWFLGDQALGDAALHDAFLRYCLLQALTLTRSVKPLNAFALSLEAISQVELPSQNYASALCVDLTIKRGDQAVTVRLVIEEPFVESWKGYWKDKIPLQIDAEAAQSTHLNLQLLAGQVALLPEDLHHLAVGDWVSLDTHGFSEDLKGARVSLRVAELEIGKGKVQGAEFTLQESLPSPFTILSKQDQE